MHRGPVSSPAYCLIMIDALASLYPVEDLDHVVAMAWNREPQDRLSDHLVGRILEYAFRGFVPACDDAVQVIADDRVVGGRDDRRVSGTDARFRAARIPLPFAR